jgi:hypothetical protein
MSIKSNTGTLPPLPFELVPLTPLPEVVELHGPLAWTMWDAAVKQQDEKK